jgi:hypothetical protein
MKVHYDAYEIVVLDSSDILEGADLSHGFRLECFRISEQKIGEAAIIFYNDGRSTRILKNRYEVIGEIIKN